MGKKIMEIAFNVPNLIVSIVLLGGVIWGLAVMIRRPLKAKSSKTPHADDSES